MHRSSAGWKSRSAAACGLPRFKLKAEVDLARDLDVSRGTVRKAISDLIAEGLLTQTHGRGTFVTPHVVEQPLADRLVTFSEDLISKGIAYETQVLEQEVTAAKGRIAALLNVAPGERVFYLKRVRRVEGEPARFPQQLRGVCAVPRNRAHRLHGRTALSGSRGGLRAAGWCAASARFRHWPPSAEVAALLEHERGRSGHARGAADVPGGWHRDRVFGPLAARRLFPIWWRRSAARARAISVWPCRSYPAPRPEQIM